MRMGSRPPVTVTGTQPPSPTCPVPMRRFPGRHAPSQHAPCLCNGSPIFLAATNVLCPLLKLQRFFANDCLKKNFFEWKQMLQEFLLEEKPKATKKNVVTGCCAINTEEPILDSSSDKIAFHSAINHIANSGFFHDGLCMNGVAVKSGPKFIILNMHASEMGMLSRNPSNPTGQGVVQFYSVVYS